MWEKIWRSYRVALEETGGVLGGVEPISRFHEAFHGPVDAAYAAAVVGLETETFLERVRENTGLQNVGLLALDNENGSVQRDTWTSSFRDVMYALDYPQQVGEPPVVTQPDVIPGTVVQIPDPNLRTLIAAELGKSPNAPITAEEMKRLRNLDTCRGGPCDRGVRDLTGLQFATNLRRINISHNQVSDISPVAGLIELRELWITDNPVSDISPVKGLTNLTHLGFERCQVSDISPVRGLTNLTHLEFDESPVSDISPLARLISLKVLRFDSAAVSDLGPLAGLISLQGLRFEGNNISDISPLAGLINLEHMAFSVNEVSDISPLAGLINLKGMRTWGNPISNLSPLAGLTNMEKLDICGARLQEASLAPLAGLTGLKELYLAGNGISDISPIARLTGLARLNLHDNRISNISALAGLTNLKWLAVDHNNVSDFSPLDRLRANTKIDWHDNPGFPKGGPKIEGPWLWVFLPDLRLDSGTDLLAEASGGSVTEMGVAAQGATVGKPVGDNEWTSHKLPLTGWDNISDMLGSKVSTGVMYGTLSLYSSQRQNTTLYVGAKHGLKVWLNGVLIRQNRGRHGNDYGDFFPVTLQQGRNVLLVAVATIFESWPGSNAFFGFEPGTEYTVGTGIGYAFSKKPIHLGDAFTFDVRAESISDLAGWQFDIAFDPAVLEAIEVSEGDFLKTDSGSTFFQSGRIDNAAGKITGLIAGRISEGGVSGSGSVLQVRFKAKSEDETELALRNFLFGSVTKESIPAGPLEIHVTVQERLLSGDVNRDGVVNILDLISVAQQLGERVPPNSPVDINSDGVVNIFDLTLVAQGIGKTTAPAAPAVATGRVDAATIEAWIAGARLADDGSIAFRQGIANLESLLASLMIPSRDGAARQLSESLQS